KTGEVDAAASLHGFDAKRGGEMAFAGSGWTEEVNPLIAIDKIKLGKRENAMGVEGRLEREVEAGERLDGGELGHPERHLHAPVLAQGQFLGEQGIDDLQGTCLAAAVARLA